MNEGIKTNEVKYRPASFHRRVLAYVIDILLVALLFFSLFSLERVIVNNIRPYEEGIKVIAEREIASGLYVYDESRNITTFRENIKNDTSLTGSEKKEKYEDEISFYSSYVKENCSPESYENLRYLYSDYCLNGNFTFLHQPYFLEEDGEVRTNPDCKAEAIAYVEDVYEPLFEEKIEPTLVVYFEDVYKATRYQSDVLLFGMIPSSFLASCLLVFMIPPLFFRRGRKTLGKLLFRIGQVDEKTMLNLSVGKWLAEEVIWNLAILLLSLFTLGIPLIISFSLMAFSKKKQDFAMYMLGIREVDVSESKIYYSMAEALQENEKNKESAERFTPMSRLD